MKYTLCITQQCNLACPYCYIGKKKAVMDVKTAQKVVDFIFQRTPPDEKIDIAFFGGEPLLEFELIKVITNIVEAQPSFQSDRVQLAVVTNGTVFADEIAEFLNQHEIAFCLSCDGPPSSHDVFRRFADGRASSAVVEGTIRKAVVAFPVVLVNAVYHPMTFRQLPQVVEYFDSLGITQIYLNADYSACWTRRDAELLPEIFEQVGERYVDFYLQGKPRFISLIDSKIVVILRGGYQQGERCRMGTAEMAFTPEGAIYPCERLIGAGSDEHCIGHVETGVMPDRAACRVGFRGALDAQCYSCGISQYCMNWCGCSNYFSTRNYGRPGAFLCASERAAIRVAFEVFQRLDDRLGAIFADHMAGLPFANSGYAF